MAPWMRPSAEQDVIGVVHLAPPAVSTPGSATACLEDVGALASIGTVRDSHDNELSPQKFRRAFAAIRNELKG